jgi:type I restriction enzyme M protein
MKKDLEKTLWATADKLRNNMDAAEYKHIVLGLIFLKYISNRFEELHARLSDDKLSNPEDKDEYLAENVFFVPPTARWAYLQHERAKLPTIGKDIDDAMDAIERDNPNLRGVLPKDYARPSLDKKRLGELIDLIGNIGFNEPGQKSKDRLGRVYEYFLGMFADAEGKRGVSSTPPKVL